MKDTPLVSIIIPTYNRADVIGETLQSIINQTYSHWECIVVDDGSVDHTKELVKEFIQKDCRISFYKRPENKPRGGNAARNFGLEISKGKLINWVDSDDKLTPNHLEFHVKAHCNAAIQASVSKAKVFNDVTADIEHYWSNIIPKADLISEMMANKTLWQTGCVVWLKSKLPLQPFYEFLDSSQEWTFHLEVLSEGLSYQLIDEVTYLARGHSERIGKKPPKTKIKSTAMSRFKIFNVYYNNKQLNTQRELILLQTISTTLEDALKYRYYNSILFTLKGLCNIFFKSQYKLKLARVIFLAPIFYLVTGKGHRLFQL